MNIIKLKDIIKPGDEFFNKYLKGKYAYWIHMRYIVPLSHMRHEGYVACEENIEKLLKREDGTYPKPYGCPYIDVHDYDIIPYIDVYETDKVNNIMEYRRLNQYVTDSNITLDEIKKFRTWLATELLKFDQNNKEEQINNIYDDNTTHMLMYYKNGMYDVVIKYLSGINNQVIVNDVNMSDCGCGGNYNILNNYKVSSCDPISIYRKDLYTKMVVLFSNMDFWTQFPKEFINSFKSYIDNIIECNLPLSQSSYINKFADCTCVNNSDSQNENASILKRLSQSLEYIYNDNLYSHKNYINDALTDWSKVLYESMEW